MGKVIRKSIEQNMAVGISEDKLRIQARTGSGRPKPHEGTSRFLGKTADFRDCFGHQ